MKEYELFLKKAIENINSYGTVVLFDVSQTDRTIIEKLERENFITSVNYFRPTAVNFQLTYKGRHYSDETEEN